MQLAKAAGAHVTGTSSTAKLGVVRAAGADEVLDHSTGDVVDGTVVYDAIIDVGGNRPLGRLRRALRKGGTLAIVGGEDGRGKVLGGFQRQMFAGVIAAFVPQRLVGVMSNEGAEPLEKVRAAAEAGVLVPQIEREYSLAEAPKALRALEARTIRGKVVVRVAQAEKKRSRVEQRSENNSQKNNEQVTRQRLRFRSLFSSAPPVCCGSRRGM